MLYSRTSAPLQIQNVNTISAKQLNSGFGEISAAVCKHLPHLPKSFQKLKILLFFSRSKKGKCCKFSLNIYLQKSVPIQPTTRQITNSLTTFWHPFSNVDGILWRKKAADAQVQDLVVPDRGPARLAEVRLRPQLPRHPPVRRLECY